MYPEPVSSNPYLADFYNDPNKYAFPLQVFMLHQRFKQAQDARKHDICIMDTSIYGTDVFAFQMYENNSMSPRDYESYCDLSKSLKALLDPPELLVYLHCDPMETVNRIMRRNRQAELEAPLSYWYQLCRAFDVFYNHYEDSKKILIDVTDINFVMDDSDEDYILDMIMETLNGESDD
jgi:deoxyadenosine/deoxycytidine kinase